MNLPKKALIIDDQSTITSIYKKVLSDLGIGKVLTAPSAISGLRTYLLERPGLVLLDINMPGKDGVALLKEIKSSDPDANVVMLTSKQDKATVIDCLRAGARNYLLKTDEVVDVRDRLVGIMNKLDFNRIELEELRSIA